MNRDELLEEYDRFCAQGRELLETKNNDYAGKDAQGLDVFGNFIACEQLGITTAERGILVRITDKIKRIINFIKDGQLLVKDEPVKDALLDAHNYIFILHALILSRKAGDHGTKEDEIKKQHPS